MAKNKINRDTIPEDFTLSLVAVDALPVIFFTLSLIVIGKLFDSLIFMAGALLCLVAGLAKVVWKLIVVLKKKNIWFLFIQMRIIMPLGLVMMIAGVFLKRDAIDLGTVFLSFTSFPSLIFFIIGFFGMGLMVCFAFNLDSSDVKANWIEQLTNGIAQIAFFLGLIFLLK